MFNLKIPKKSQPFTSEDYMSVILGEKSISPEDVEKIASNLIGKNSKQENSKIVKRLAVWKYSSKLLKRGKTKTVDISLDPANLDLVNDFLNGDLDADTLSNILEDMDDF